mgnify:CR=1 FL=1
MRASGILMPVFSLPGPFGIGTLGKEAFAFVDFLADAKQTYWQILPIGPTGYGDSPYQSFSAFAGNPYFIDYRLLADFNGTVLAAHPTRLGVQFVTWDWSCDRTGLNQGHYFQDNYTGAKQDFAIRAGLVSKQLIFNEAQLTEIYRCCTDTLDAGVDLTVDQEQCIKSVQEQILRGMPNILERMREQEQHSLDSQSQELTM